MKIIGRNAVIEAIKSGQTIDRLVAARDQKDVGAQKVINEAKSRGIKVFFYDKEVLDRESGGKKHQGFIAEVTDFKYCELEDILAYADEKGQPPFVLILDGVEDPHNLGAIMRSAECAGAHGVIIPKRRSVGLTAVVAKASAGAVEYMKVARVGNINNAISELKQRGVWIFGTAAEGSIPMYKADLSGPAAIVIGNEGQGMSPLVRKNCDVTVHIPMKGRISSLNASAAASILLYEAVRQRLG